jgi:hypothetical protein
MTGLFNIRRMRWLRTIAVPSFFCMIARLLLKKCFGELEGRVIHNE